MTRGAPASRGPGLGDLARGVAAEFIAVRPSPVRWPVATGTALSIGIPLGALSAFSAPLSGLTVFVVTTVAALVLFGFSVGPPASAGPPGVDVLRPRLRRRRPSGHAGR